MGHKRGYDLMIYGHQKLLQRPLSNNPETLPPNVNVKKLEHSYNLLEGYELVLRKKVSA